MEELIKNNRAAFDDRPLPEGHAQRFAVRLEAERLKNVRPKNVRPKDAGRRRTALLFPAMAGVAAALVALVLVLRMPARDCSLKSELADVNAYYGAMMEDGVARAERAARRMTPEARRDLMESVAEMEVQTRDLLEELCRSQAPAPTAERILIGHYKSQIAILQQING